MNYFVYYQLSLNSCYYGRCFSTLEDSVSFSNLLKSNPKVIFCKVTFIDSDDLEHVISSWCSSEYYKRFDDSCFI